MSKIRWCEVFWLVTAVLIFALALALYGANGYAANGYENQMDARPEPPVSYGYNADVDRPATIYDAERLFRNGRFSGVNATLNKFHPPFRGNVNEVLPYSRAQIIECARSMYCYLFWGVDRARRHGTSISGLKREFGMSFVRFGREYPGVTDEDVPTGWHMIALLKLRGNPDSLRPPSEATLQGRRYARANIVAFLGVLDPSVPRGKTIVTKDVVGRDGYVLVRDNGGRMDILVENIVTNQYWYATEILPRSGSTHRRR
ncbi:MAG: hypothetical protein AAB769_01590 [Patescibacteria group bacterium]